MYRKSFFKKHKQLYSHIPGLGSIFARSSKWGLNLFSWVTCSLQNNCQFLNTLCKGFGRLQLTQKRKWKGFYNTSIFKCFYSINILNRFSSVFRFHSRSINDELNFHLRICPMKFIIRHLENLFISYVVSESR